MKKILFLLLLCTLLLSGCLRDTMYVKPVVLDEEDIHKMLIRNGGIFEYKIDDSIKMITWQAILYEKDAEPETIFENKTFFSSELPRKTTSKLILQISKSHGYISLLTEGFTAEKIFEGVKFDHLAYVPLNKKVSIEPDVAIPLLVMPSAALQNPYFEIDDYINNPEIVEQYPPIIIFSLIFHSDAGLNT